MRTHQDRGQKDGSREQQNWKVYHQYIFTLMDMQWPVDPVAFDGINSGGMLPREKEAAAFLNKVFPPRHAIEFLDVNPQLAWLIKERIRDDGTIVQGSTPWRSRIPTLTGSAKMLIRERAEPPAAHRVRLMEGVESFRLIGWSDDLWRIDAPEDKDEVQPGQKAFSELLSDMAGNAYAVWHAIPWVMALLAVIGKYGKKPAAPESPPDTHEASQSTGSQACSSWPPESSDLAGGFSQLSP